MDDNPLRENNAGLDENRRPGMQMGMNADEKREMEFPAEEEYSAEVAPAEDSSNQPLQQQAKEEQSEETDAEDSRWIGYLALASSIIAMFVWPAVLGSLGLAAGIVSYWQGHRTLGAWSVALGLISLIGYFILVPRYA